MPVARAFWKAQPDLKTAAAAWIYAGGPQHAVLRQAVTTEQIEDFAEILGIELVTIDGRTHIGDIRKELCGNAACYGKH